MFKCKTSPGNYVFKEGDERAQCFFVIETGEVAVEIKEQEKCRMGPWQSFGELAILYSNARSASIKAITECTFWGLDRTTFKLVVERTSQMEFEENKQFLEKTSFFKLLSTDQKNDLTRLVSSQRFQPGEDIVRKGDVASSYYIIKEGAVVCLDDGNLEVRNLYAGDSFGEQALYFKSKRMLTVRALKPTKVIAVARDKIASILGGHIQDLIYKSFLRWKFSMHPTVSKLTRLQRERLIEICTYRTVREGERIICTGHKVKCAIIVINGRSSKVSCSLFE